MQRDILDKDRIGIWLDNKEKIRDILIFDTVNSTNLYAKELAYKGAKSGTVVIAEEQSQGRGRMGRSFFSPKGSGLYFSMIIRPEISLDDILMMTSATGVCVCRAIEKATGDIPKIKWVNDILVDGKKVCGILAESVYNSEKKKIDAVILGIGINCNTIFGENLKAIAGNIQKGKDEDIRNRLAAELINELADIENIIKNGLFLDEYKKRSMILGEKVRILQENDEVYTAEDIDSKGNLVLKDKDNKLRILNSGEVSIRKYRER